MSKVEEYIQGWMTDDLDMVQGACAEDFVYDDPYDGQITKAQFPDYWQSMAGDGDFDDTVMEETDGVETGFAWWHWTPEGAPDEQTGCMFMKADADGLHSARLAYYKR
jgi:hypothetical protein